MWTGILANATRLASVPPAWFFGMKWAGLKILIGREAGF
ncbi:hypothetical protein AB434_3914 [Heyndrickxia coagulans]|uniref:Uncharacterized protein n=1 Tax=Heyndrickxia coagulans TaxID=1398 RepID=A0AAN0WBD5_HEYCO|nr:hypothetical protein SB48_HM08orf02112 [Heyndrickxia coagulans]AKN56319.1 hypothetical protein AB434_3914 [Heyndrickxia coagulans]